MTVPDFPNVPTLANLNDAITCLDSNPLKVFLSLQPYQQEKTGYKGYQFSAVNVSHQRLLILFFLCEIMENIKDKRLNLR